MIGTFPPLTPCPTDGCESVIDPDARRLCASCQRGTGLTRPQRPRRPAPRRVVLPLAAVTSNTRLKHQTFAGGHGMAPSGAATRAAVLPGAAARRDFATPDNATGGIRT